MLTVETTPLYECSVDFHLWALISQSTGTEIHPRSGDLCVCGARRWPHRTVNPPVRDSRTTASTRAD